MKIGFLTSKRAEKQYKELFDSIIHYLEKNGNEVIHFMNTPLEQIIPMSFADRQEVFMDFYRSLEECDIVFVETTLQSTQVGFGLAMIRMKGRPTVILTQGDIANQFFPKGDVYSNLDNMMAYHYSKETLFKVLDEALEYMEPHIDKRFTMIFPAHMLAKVEEVAHKKKLPKAVYIRQLIEENLQKNS